MSTDKLLSALRSVEGGALLNPVSKKLARLVEEQNPSIRATGKPIPARRHLEILSFRNARDHSLITRAEGWAATLIRLQQQQNDVLLIGVDVIPLPFIVLLDAQNGSVVGVYSHPKPSAL